MSYHLRNYRHRNPKGGDEKKGGSEPFFRAPARASVQKKEKAGFFQAKKQEEAAVQRLATSKEDEKLGTNDARMEKDKEEPMKPVQKQEAKGKEEEKPDQKKGKEKKEEEKPVQKKSAVGEKKKKKKGAGGAGKGKPVQKKESKKPPKEEKKEPHKGGKKNEHGDDKKHVDDKKHAHADDKKAPHKKEEGMNSATIAAELKKQSGKGSPLPPKVMAGMGKALGFDFSRVRIHHDAAAAELCKELHAVAFTHGQDIYFNEGKYNPESADGKKLLAHELTHVVQQANSIDK